MELSVDLINEFAKATKSDPPKKGENVLYGTVVTYEGSQYVRLDGSELLTPVTTAVMSTDGDRVLVTIQNHTATVTANVSAPATSESYVKGEIGSVITEVEILIADKVDTIELDAERARIDELEAKNVTITGELDAAKANIEELEAKNVTITGELDAAAAEIENLKATKLDAEIADITYATIEDLKVTNATINNLQADYGEFKDLTTDKFTAVDAKIENLDAEKISVEDAEIKFANIDFSNIGKAAIEEFFAKSGMIGDLVVGDGTITGTLIGVTIKGDLIEGGTVKADKLVIKGSDGLYYKLNTNGETVSSEQTDYNSLNGSIITAKSITAEKVNVNDLVAFGATIGGFHIKEDAIYSGVKETVDNTTRGVYMDDDGQVSFGDSQQYLKFYRGPDGTYKLDISAGSIKFGAKGESVEDAIDGVKENSIVSSKEQFYSSLSPTELSDGSWADEQPTWTQGRYIWRRTLNTYGDGHTEYSPNENGICITGNNGASGTSIKSITDEYYLSTSKTEQVGGAWSETPPTWSNGNYIWTRTKIVYDNPEKTVYTTPICDSSWEAVNDISVGVRNQFINSELPDFLVNAGSEITKVEPTIVVEWGGLRANRYLVSGGSTKMKMYLSRGVVAKSGELYVVSGYVKNNGTKPITIATNMIGTQTIQPGYSDRVIIYAKSVGGNPQFRFETETVEDELDVTVCRLQLQSGNKVTDWTPAPEDMATAEDAENAQNAADNAQSTANSNSGRLDVSESAIEVLKNSISTLVVDENGSSMMEQTGDGWSFNIGGIQKNVADALEEVKSVANDLGITDGQLSNLQDLVNDVTKKTAYIKIITDEEGNPCIELGKEDSEFKVRITNTSVDFMEGNSKIAYVNNNSLYIERAVIKNELQIGDGNGFIWKRRSNGNMGLRWIGG